MMEWSLMKRLIWQRAIGGGSPSALTTVTGDSPLTLANALAKPIKSLIQYGKCTAASDGGLYFNNGKIVALDDELPEGYKRITGIKFDGDFYYDTGEVLSGADEVTMTLANTSTQGQNVFGSYNGSNKPNFSLFIYGGGSSSNSYFRYGTQLLRPKFGSNEHSIVLNGSGTIGFQTDASTSGYEDFETEATAYIGMLPNSTSPGYTGSILGTISIGEWASFIPCEREEDGAIGYFYPGRWEFLEPIGTGTPVKGSYDSSHLNIWGVDGDPELITLGNQVAYAQNLFAVGDVKDEQDIITGVVTHRTRLDVVAGQITITPIANAWQEPSRAYPLRTAEGSNTIEIESEVGAVPLSVTYSVPGE